MKDISALSRVLLAGVLLLCWIGLARADEVLYIHVDVFGSPVAYSDEHGNVVARVSYDPYGSPTGGELKEGPGYTGHVADIHTSLVYAQQRYYDPEIGMFLSPDPVSALEDPLKGFNRYRYGNSNPYRFGDPDGRKSLAFHDLRDASCQSRPECRFAMEGEGNSTWEDVKSRLGLSGDLTKNGNILDMGSLFHDLLHPAMEMPAGKGVKLAGLSFFALRMGPVARPLAGLGNIGSHGPVNSDVALNSATRWLGKGYAELGPGVYRSADGLRQFRMTTSDLKGAHGSIGSHVHFEALDKTGKVVENLHLGIKP